MSESDRQISRRRLLGGAGLAVVAGAAAGSGITVAAEADSDSGSDGHGDAVGSGPDGTTTVEFHARIAQTGPMGEQFTSTGFLTRANGLSNTDLFGSGTAGLSAALFTAYGSGQIVARLHEDEVHTVDVAGQIAVYQRTSGGADYANPDSFKTGTLVAQYAITFQDVLTVFAPGKGIPTLTGDMKQSVAKAVSGGKKFGFTGQRLRFFATGLGTLTDPATLNSTHVVAGNWSAETGA